MGNSILLSMLLIILLNLVSFYCSAEEEIRCSSGIHNAHNDGTKKHNIELDMENGFFANNGIELERGQRGCSESEPIF